MDFKITATKGGKKNTNKESKSYTVCDVQSEKQVTDAVHEQFAEYFKNITTLDEVKPRSKKNTA